MRNYLKEIREKTSGMGRKEACSYIFTYYWYHMLGIAAAAALILLFAVHYGFGNKKPVFTCVIVNQVTDGEEDLRLRDDFAGWAGLQKERIVIDSSYLFSYGDLRMEGTNESSYEKFFFQWYTKEIDAVLMPESFYWHCKRLEYDFMEFEELLSKEQRVSLNGQLLLEDKKAQALYIEKTQLSPYVEEMTEDATILVFLSNEKHLEAKKAFLKFATEK